MALNRRAQLVQPLIDRQGRVKIGHRESGTACLDPRSGAQYSGFDFLELTVDGLVVFLPAAYLAQLLAERVAVAVKAVG